MKLICFGRKMITRKIRVPRVTKKELLKAFDHLCNVVGVYSAGFDPSAITAPIDGSRHDGKTRWAMKHDKKYGWMVVCGAGGCGSSLTRWNGYMKTRWNFLMMIEAVSWALVRERSEKRIAAGQ